MQNKNYLSFILIVAFVAVFSILVSSGSTAVKTNIENIKQVNIAGQTLDVELAITPEAKAQGLSGRSELKDNESMLFVFDSPGIHSFWMKDMKFSIDIIWLDESLQVVYIKKNARVDSYPEAFSPDENALYVLETVAGFAEKNNLKVGDKVEFIY